MNHDESRSHDLGTATIDAAYRRFFCRRASLPTHNCHYRARDEIQALVNNINDLSAAARRARARTSMSAMRATNPPLSSTESSRTRSGEPATPNCSPQSGRLSNHRTRARHRRHRAANTGHHDTLGSQRTTLPEPRAGGAEIFSGCSIDLPRRWSVLSMAIDMRVTRASPSTPT